jgi:hypothetical protein
MHARNRHIALSGMFIAMGLILPALFHAVGLGSIFMPMFWPVAMAAFFLPWTFSFLVAVLTPLLSFMLTGMPPASPPILHMMIAELAGLALTIALLHGRVQWGLFWILLAGLAVSRVLCFFSAMGLATVMGLPAAWSAWAMTVKGVPGLTVILLLLPLLLQRLTHETLFKEGKR